MHIILNIFANNHRLFPYQIHVFVISLGKQQNSIIVICIKITFRIVSQMSYWNAILIWKTNGYINRISVNFLLSYFHHFGRYKDLLLEILNVHKKDGLRVLLCNMLNFEKLKVSSALIY